MKKILPKILIILNIIFIVFLCLVSGLMLFMSSSSPKYLFGRSAVVFTDVVNNVPQYKLLLIQKDLSSLDIGDQVVYYTTDFEEKKSYFVNAVTAMDEEILAFEGEENYIERSSPALLGKVTSENQWLGNLLFSIQNSGNRSTFYILILSLFMVLSIVAVLLLIVYERKKSNSPQIVSPPVKQSSIDIEIDDSDEPMLDFDEEQDEEATPMPMQPAPIKPIASSSRPPLEIIYEDEAGEDGELIRRPKAVAPAPLSQSNLSSNNPLHTPHSDHITPPTNIGSQKARRFIPFDERDAQAELIKESTGELDLSAFYEVVEHTTELIYTEELVDNTGAPVVTKPKPIPQVEDQPVAKPAMPEIEDVPPEKEFNFNIDSMLEDIISQAQNDLYSNKKD